MTNNSQETSVDNAVPEQSSTAAGPALNEGKGVKTQIVMAGPLAQVLSRALNLHFQKTPLGEEENPQVENQEEAAVARESEQQDGVILQQVEDMEDEPELSVVLDGIDVMDIKAHVARVESGQPLLESDIERPVIPVYVTSKQGAMDPNEAMPLLDKGSDWRAILLVVSDPLEEAAGAPGSQTALIMNKEAEPASDVATTPNDTAQALDQEDAERHAAADAETASQDQAAIEAIYQGTGIQVCYGLKGFASTVKKWKY